MGILGNTRHSLGFHTGEWTYDVPGRCAQTRRCTGCGKVATRTRHTLDEWHRRSPCEEDTCGLIRTCTVCGEAEFKARHEFTWHYLTEVADLPDIPAKPALAKAARKALAKPCKQFSMCDHCHKTAYEYREWHDMGPSVAAGYETFTLMGGEEVRTVTYFRACKICDTRMPGAPD